MIPPHLVESFAVSLMFAFVFFLGGMLHRPGSKWRRGLLSFSAGAAVAYIFVHLSPELYLTRDEFIKETAHLSLSFHELWINLATMLGFVVFYGLEQFIVGSKEESDKGDHTELGENNTLFRIHIGVFGVYALLVSYLLVRSLEKGFVPIWFYAAAMSFHFLTVGNSLHREYKALYDRVGTGILSAFTLIGWGLGVMIELPKPVVSILFGFIAGGVIVNTMISELPREKEGRFGPFLSGAICYTALLLLAI